MAAKRGYSTYPHTIRATGENISVPVDRATKASIGKILPKLTLQEQSVIASVVDAFYQFGHKDGAKLLFDSIDALKGKIAYKRPGRPRKKAESAPKKASKTRKKAGRGTPRK